MIAVLKAIGLFAVGVLLAIVGGAVLGLLASVAVSVAWGFLAVLELGRSPGSDPLVPLVFLWFFFLAPAMTLAGAALGGLIWSVRLGWVLYRDSQGIDE